MTYGPRPRSLAARCGLAAAVLLASLAAWSGHTDDGCVVELHCFACYWALAATVEQALTLEPAPALEPAGFHAPVERERPIAAERPVPTSRGPPSP